MARRRYTDVFYFYFWFRLLEVGLRQMRPRSCEGAVQRDLIPFSFLFRLCTAMYYG